MKRKPGTFDAYQMAREKGVLEGTLDVGASERLADRVAPGDASVSWHIEGTADEIGRPALEISIAGAVALTCQRCLSDFVWPVEQRTLTILAKSEAQGDEYDAGTDHEVVVADHLLDPAVLVEDELLLTLPFAPMHEEACAPGGVD